MKGNMHNSILPIVGHSKNRATIVLKTVVFIQVRLKFVLTGIARSDPIFTTN